MTWNTETNCDQGLIEGTISNDPELQTIDNPYYDGEAPHDVQNNAKQKIIPNFNDTEVITSTNNIYYRL